MSKLYSKLLSLRIVLLTFILILCASTGWASRVYVSIGDGGSSSSYYRPNQVAWVAGHWYNGRWIPGHYVEYAPPSPGVGYIWYQGGWDNRGHWNHGSWKHQRQYQHQSYHRHH